MWQIILSCEGKSETLEIFGGDGCIMGQVGDRQILLADLLTETSNLQAITLGSPLFGDPVEIRKKSL